MKIHFVICLFIYFVHVTIAAEWTYEEDETGPGAWERAHSDCGGVKQSPIHIQKGDLEEDPKLGMIESVNYGRPIEADLLNNGHTLVAQVKGSPAPRIRGGGLVQDATLLQFHFHWGKTNDYGSEHVVYSVHYPLELHLVHKFDEDKMGYAVLGVMFEIGKENNQELQKILSHAKKVKFKGSATAMTSPIDLSNLLPSNRSRYYRYQGSLTTPPCTEAVVWTLFMDPLTVSEHQMEVFRSLYSGNSTTSSHLSHNYRPVQPLNDRKVYVPTLAKVGGVPQKHDPHATRPPLPPDPSTQADETAPEAYHVPLSHILIPVIVTLLVVGAGVICSLTFLKKKKSTPPKPPTEAADTLLPQKV